MTTNPFTNRVAVEEQPAEEPAIEDDVVLGSQVETSGPKRPLARRDESEPAPRLPVVESTSTALVRVVTTHGGAGGSPLADLLGDALARAEGASWHTGRTR